jgi:hypothetical protein
MAESAGDMRARVLLLRKQLKEKSVEIGILRSQLQTNNDVLARIDAVNACPRVSKILGTAASGFPYELSFCYPDIPRDFNGDSCALSVDKPTFPTHIVRKETDSGVEEFNAVMTRNRFSVNVRLANKSDKQLPVTVADIHSGPQDLAFRLDVVYADRFPYQVVNSSNAYMLPSCHEGMPLFENNATFESKVMDANGKVSWSNLRANFSSYETKVASARPFRLRVLCTNPEFSALSAYSKPFYMLSRVPKKRARD